MDINIIGTMLIPAITIACLCIGYVLKQWLPTDHKWIPTVLFLVGAVSGIILFGLDYEGIVKGMVSGLAAVGLHQAFKQYLNLPKDKFEKALTENGIDITDEEELPEGIGGSFTPRMSAPSATDKNWIHTSKGGYNSCILIKGNSCLPNCVGYAWGRWRELLKKAPALSRGNAEDWWAYGDGYKRGQTPKLGAVAVWKKGKAGYGADGAGHVAVVENIAADGTVTFSNSAYGGTRFYLHKMKKGKYELGGTYSFLGFIYPPETYDAEPKKESSSKTTSVKYTVGKTYTLQDNMKVRTSGSTSARQLKRSELTADGKKNALSGTYAVLKKGTKVTCLQIKGDWMKIPSGWVCCKEGTKIYIK